MPYDEDKQASKQTKKKQKVNRFRK
jgi:hypothetical protein